MTAGGKVRAVRNNNPGNIRVGSPWQGLMPLDEMSDAQRNEKDFCVFKSPQWGFRALANTLITYYDKRRDKNGTKIDTIVEVISRWAPPSENDTIAYIRAVDKAHPRRSDEPFNMHDYADLAPLVKAIAIHECGGWFFDDDDLDAGLRLAGVPKPAEALSNSRTVRAATVAGAATSISIVANTVNDVAPLTGLIREVAEYAPLVAGIAVLILVGAIIYFKFDEWRRAKT